MTSPEGEIAQELERLGTHFLGFHGVVLKGEAVEEQMAKENAGLIEQVSRLASVLRQRAPELRLGRTVGTGPRSSSLRAEVEQVASSLALTAEKMRRLGTSVPSFSESDSLLPLRGLRERLREMGHRLIVVSSGWDEADRVLGSEATDHVHLGRLERRLHGQMEGLLELMQSAREEMSVAIVEFRLSTRKKG